MALVPANGGGSGLMVGGYDPGGQRTGNEVALQQRRADDDKHGAVTIEKGIGHAGAAFSLANVHMSEEDVELIRAMEGIAVTFGKDKKDLNGTTFSWRMEELYDLAIIRARQRFPRADRLPSFLYGGTDVPLKDVASGLAVNATGVRYSVPETAVRLVIFMSGSCRIEDFDPDFNPANDADIIEHVGDKVVHDEREALQYLAGLGIALLIMSVAKPFVDRITSSVADMCRNMRVDLNIEEGHLNPQVFADMFQKYFRKVDIPRISQGIVGRTFPGWAWATAYAARYGAGTSHLTCIATFMSQFPDCPLFGFIPNNEFISFRAATDLVAEDPLALFPIREVANLSLDQYRAFAMPSLIILSTFGLQASGSANWSRYQNVPYVQNVGTLPISVFITATIQWIKAKMSGVTMASILQAGRSLDEYEDFLDGNKIGAFIQAGGKMKSALQKNVRMD